MSAKLVTLILMVMVVSGAVLAQSEGPISPTAQAIVQRGALNCGVNANLPGFGRQDANGVYQGFDADICRAVAAAILGDAEAVNFIVVNAPDRAAALNDGLIDMLARNTTFTYSRDISWNATFGPVVFYDGQGFMVRPDSGIRTLQDLAGSIICTTESSSSVTNLADAMNARGLDYEVIELPNSVEIATYYNQGRCDAITTDVSGLVAIRSITEAGPVDGQILDIRISKEPLAPVSAEGDPKFADIIRWTVYGLILAEELGITSQNLASFTTSLNPNVQYLLGLDVPSGELMGLENDFMQNVLRQVGNYGEIYERHLAPLDLPRSLNDLWTRGGLMYAPPFR
jgi:general L-amino acid transport system substrate-binding protein